MVSKVNKCFSLKNGIWYWMFESKLDKKMEFVEDKIKCLGN